MSNEANEEKEMNIELSSSNSYLVRVWQETGPDSEVRFYLRDLKTGEERYLGDAQRIGELLTRGLKVEGSTQSRRRGTA